MCPDKHVLHWQSQATVNCIPAGNLLLAAARPHFFVFTSIANLADVLNIAMFDIQ